MVADETFDVGVDTRTGVNDNDYQVPFRFNGKINKLTFKLGPVQLSKSTRKSYERHAPEPAISRFLQGIVKSQRKDKRR